MTKLNSKQDRRLHPRIAQSVPVKIAANGFDFATTTLNVSCVGAYCTIQKYIPPFTRLAIKMALPQRQLSPAHPFNVECKGVVVRTEDTDSGGFNIAIFFNDIKDNQKEKINQYIHRYLPK